MNADGSGVEQLTSSQRPMFAGDPAWSPDGSSLAFNMLDSDGFSRIYVLELSSGQVRLLTPHDGVSWGPSWSPDGARIVFAREERPAVSYYDLYAIPAEGGAGEQLTDDPAADGDPCWAPF